MLLSEIRYSLRNLWKTPGFALTAILTLALSIGASTAVFTVLDSVILKPLNYRDSGKLVVVVWEKVKFLVSRSTPYTGPNPRHEDLWKEHSSVFSGLCLLGVGTRGVSLGVDHPHLVGSIRAQPNFPDILEVTPFMGRNFNPSGVSKGGEPPFRGEIRRPTSDSSFRPTGMCPLRARNIPAQRSGSSRPHSSRRLGCPLSKDAISTKPTATAANSLRS